MQILALDDEAGGLKILLRAIQGAAPEADVEGFNVVWDALDFAKKTKVDVAFLDIQMPDLTGLEVAKRLKKMNPDVNIIFSTGYSEYALEAMKMHSSGYLMKPITKKDVAAELASLRNPISNGADDKRIRIKTFGNFDIFLDGKPITFKRSKAKEILAFLVDRRGSTCTRKDIAAYVFEDRDYSRATQTYLTQVLKNMTVTLEEMGIPEFLIIGQNSYAINAELATCDSYDYLDGIPEALNQFHGEYMIQYSWAEESTYQFYE